MTSPSRRSQTRHRNVGQGRGHDQDHDTIGSIRQLGLPAAPGKADEQGERGHRSAPAGAAGRRVHRRGGGREHPRGGGGELLWCACPRWRACRRVAAAAGVERKRGAVSGALPRSRSPVAAPGAGAGPAAPSSGEGPAPQLLPPTNFSASTPVSLTTGLRSLV